MRRVILLMLVVLLPLNGWAAAASLGCLHAMVGDSAVGGAGLSDGAAHAGHTVHSDHSDHSDHSHHSHHAGPDDHTAAHAAADEGTDCAHAECGVCCHAGSTAAFGVPRLPWTGPDFGYAAAAAAVTSPDSPALDGPFRPPRTASA
jgi:uncharacterized Fe-S cluster protein YjdI